MLTKALQDLKDEVLAGAAVQDVVADIAAQYKLNPVLLSRKFAESYTSEEALRSTAAAIDPEKNLADRVARKVAEICKSYKVPVEATKVITFRGVTYTAIFRDSHCRVRQVVAVSHADARVWQLAA